MDRTEYAVGRFTLQPFRQLLAAGRPVPVKRKALAILSVLAEAGGSPVSKDELMAAVWPNVNVEDNAIQAHVTALRKILGQDAELLCTLHGYGYRLAATPESSPVETRAEPAPLSAPDSRRRLSTTHILLTLMLLVVAAGSLWLWRAGFPSTPVIKPAQIAILPFDLSGSGPQIGGFANDLRDRIAVELSAARILIASTPPSSGQANGPPDAEFVLGGRIKADGKMFDVHIQISDSAEHVAVWSGTFQKSESARAALLANVATAAANAAHWAVIGRNGKVRLNAASVAAFVEARDSIGGVQRSSLALETADYRKIIAAAPDFTWGHSGLAVADAFQFRFEPGNKTARQEAREEANRALALDPHNGEAYVALALVLDRFNWQPREVLLLKGAAADPDFAPTAIMEGRLLWSVGRNADALAWFKRAYNIDPLLNTNSFLYATILAEQGHVGESQKLLAQMDAQWPDHNRTRDAYFWTSVLSGATADALALLADPARWPLGMNRKSAQAWQAALSVSISKDVPARVRAMKTIKDAATDGSLTHGEALLLLSMLNDVDGAFAQAQLYEPADPKWGPFLFLDPAQAMRSDPRFMALAVKLGFAAYWRSTGRWPDFCNAPSLPYDCKAEVEKLAAGNPGLTPMTVRQPIAATN